jgi:flagellar biosynthesis protein
MNENEQKKAAALKYSEDNNAPEVIAHGRGEIASKIIEKAKEYDIPLYKNSELAESLNNLSLGREIPKELYEVVAQILIYIAELDEIRGKSA